jgi:hypothetical protein
MTQHHKLKYQRNETIVSRLDVLVHDTLQRPPTIEERLLFIVGYFFLLFAGGLLLYRVLLYFSREQKDK